MITMALPLAILICVVSITFVQRVCIAKIRWLSQPLRPELYVARLFYAGVESEFSDCLGVTSQDFNRFHLR